MASAGLEGTTTISPGTNFYEYVNGTWLASTPIPADKSNYGSFTVLADEAEDRCKPQAEGEVRAHPLIPCLTIARRR